MEVNHPTKHAILLLLFAASHPTRLVKKSEVAQFYGVHENSLTKVVYALQKSNYIETKRGRNGGLKLAKSPININMGEILNLFENVGGSKNKKISSDDQFIVELFLGRAYTMFSEFLHSITLKNILDKREKILSE